MYCLSKSENSVECILAYTIGAMTKENYSEDEIDKYIEDIKREKLNYNNVIEISNSILDNCNERSLPIE